MKGYYSRSLIDSESATGGVMIQLYLFSDTSNPHPRHPIDPAVLIWLLRLLLLEDFLSDGSGG